MPSQPRRDFLFGSTLALIGVRTSWTGIHRQPAPPDEAWLNGLGGLHQAFFDVDAIRDAILGRVDNFLGAYHDAYGLRDNQLNVVFGAHGSGLGFVLNDAMWAKYQLGRLYKVDDPRSGTPATRNIFSNWEDSYGWPTDYSVRTLQRRGVRFLACRGTMRSLSRQLAGGGGEAVAAEIRDELEANLVAGAIPVPAMIVAQNRAQEAGLKYVYVI